MEGEERLNEGLHAHCLYVCVFMYVCICVYSAEKKYFSILMSDVSGYQTIFELDRNDNNSIAKGSQPTKMSSRSHQHLI